MVDLEVLRKLAEKLGYELVKDKNCCHLTDGYGAVIFCSNDLGSVLEWLRKKDG